MQKYNFNGRVVSDIFEGLDSASGSRYFSDTHRLLKDRKFLIVNKIEPTDTSEYLICRSAESVNHPISLRFKSFEINPDFKISKTRDTIHVDADKIKFPLTLRKWQHGDSFRPFGMKKNKKLSDFFIDEKISRNQKEDIWLLVSGNKIVWIVGLRTDDRFRITEETVNILEISLNQ